MKVSKPAFVFEVILKLDNGKEKKYWSTDFPSIASDWITIYQNTKRIMETTRGVVSVEYDVYPAK